MNFFITGINQNCSPTCNYCKLRNKQKNIQLQDKKEEIRPRTSLERSQRRTKLFSIFIFPTFPALVEEPSSAFSIYKFPEKEFPTPSTSPYSIFQQPPGNKEKKPSKFSFFSSSVKNQSFNLYQRPRSQQVANIYETWTHSFINEVDSSGINGLNDVFSYINFVRD